MGQQRVLILTSESLLGDSIRHLLDGEPDINLVGEAPVVPASLDTIDRLRPDVIIVVEDEFEPDISATVCTVLARDDDILLLRIGLREPCVRIYERRQAPATSLALKETLRNLSPMSVVSSQ